MSLYLFTTEDSYGGTPKIFTSHIAAVAFQGEFNKITDGLVDSKITKHEVFPTVISIDSSNNCEEFYLIGNIDEGAIVCNTLDKLKLRPTHRVINK